MRTVISVYLEFLEKKALITVSDISGADSVVADATFEMICDVDPGLEESVKTRVRTRSGSDGI